MPAHEDDPWRQCYRELAPKLLLFARQWLPELQDAEDAVQLAFVRFWKKHRSAAREHYPLLYAAVRTIALDLLRGTERRVRRENHPEAPLPRDGVPAFELATHDLDRAELAVAIENTLRSLPEEQRTVVVLKVWGELTFQEIASTLDAPLNTVTARYRYALEKLRNRIHLYERA
jgi:RNA polymerase sigma-70 factor (ECF subfamily)